MKTLITAQGNEKTALFDKRFGRAAWFCIFKEDTHAIEFIKNEHADSQSGAGTKAAETVANLGVTKVISGDFGPKAKELLEKLNIQLVILNDNPISIAEIIEKLNK